MRISFDLDDTLICYHPAVPCEQHVPWWLRLFYQEPMRRGARTLLRELIAREHEVWIYTTSYRAPGYLRRWFRSFGVRLAGVVNQNIHDRVVKRTDALGYSPSKYPPAFGIDLHVDDSDGVALEGRRLGFSVVVVAPDDPEWTRRVLEAIQSRTARKG
jgi:FMN phosphatase YigB (HAD superfamily)